MNLKRGLFGIWIIASVIWFCGWLWYIWPTCSHPVLAEQHITYCYTGFSEWQSRVPLSLGDYASILAAGFSVPIAAFVLRIAMLWALEGFKIPKKPN